MHLTIYLVNVLAVRSYRSAKHLLPLYISAVIHSTIYLDWLAHLQLSTRY